MTAFFRLLWSFLIAPLRWFEPRVEEQGGRETSPGIDNDERCQHGVPGLCEPCFSERDVSGNGYDATATDGSLAYWAPSTGRQFTVAKFAAVEVDEATKTITLSNFDPGDYRLVYRSDCGCSDVFATFTLVGGGSVQHIENVQAADTRPTLPSPAPESVAVQYVVSSIEEYQDLVGRGTNPEMEDAVRYWFSRSEKDRLFILPSPALDGSQPELDLSEFATVPADLPSAAKVLSEPPPAASDESPRGRQ